MLHASTFQDLLIELGIPPGFLLEDTLAELPHPIFGDGYLCGSFGTGDGWRIGVGPLVSSASDAGDGFGAGDGNEGFPTSQQRADSGDGQDNCFGFSSACDAGDGLGDGHEWPNNILFAQAVPSGRQPKHAFQTGGNHDG